MARHIRTAWELEQDIRRIRDALTFLSQGKHSYKEARKYVDEGRRDVIRSDENQGFRVAVSDISDPTSEVVVSQEANRRRLEDANVALSEALTAVQLAVSRVKDVFSHPDDYFGRLESYRP